MGDIGDIIVKNKNFGRQEDFLPLHPLKRGIFHQLLTQKRTLCPPKGVFVSLSPKARRGA